MLTPIGFSRRFSELAAEAPDHVAVIFLPAAGGEEFWTRRQLDQWMNRLAHWLAARGIGPSSWVVIGLPNGPLHLVRPGRDVMAGVAALKARGIIDETKMAVSGWSYGGYMTAWLTAHYQGWKAAVAGAAVTDWFDWYNLADMNTWAGYGLGGSPWLNNNAMNYWRQSPMASAHQIKTPTLILSTTGDPRVTVTQSYKLYHALKDNGTPVQFIVYPTGGHFPPDPVHQRDIRRRWIEWITKQFETP